MFMRYYEVEENLPDDAEYRLVYSEAFGSYHIAKFNPARGWLTTENYSIRVVSHWCDEPLPMPFTLTNSFDDEVAASYGFQFRVPASGNIY
jgi:hypothetical protein